MKDRSLENGESNSMLRQLDVGIDNEHHGVNGIATSKDTFNSNMDGCKDDSIQREHHNQKTESLLARFEKSHFFVRFAESDEPLWSKKMKNEPSEGGSKNVSTEIFLNSNIDSGNFHGCTSGGLSTSSAKCHSLSNGDIVVCFFDVFGVSSSSIIHEFCLYPNFQLDLPFIEFLQNFNILFIGVFQIMFCVS